MEHSWQQWCHHAHCVNEKGNQLKVDYLFKIAPAGFEPARSGTRSHRLTAWPRGNYSNYFTYFYFVLQVQFLSLSENVFSFILLKKPKGEHHAVRNIREYR